MSVAVAQAMRYAGCPNRRSLGVSDVFLQRVAVHQIAKEDELVLREQLRPEVGDHLRGLAPLERHFVVFYFLPQIVDTQVHVLRLRLKRAP